ELQARVAQLDEEVSHLERELAELTRPEAPDLVEAIRSRGSDEIARYRLLRARAEQSDIPAERAIILDEIVKTYGDTFWRLEGTRL
ncbi:MAG: hypothetical protein ACRDWH_11010, partial [Acidimicrobiia bacterium]